MPRRRLGREMVDHVDHPHRLDRWEVAGCVGDQGGEQFGCDAEIGDFAAPPCPQIGDTVAGLVNAGVGRGLAAEHRSFPPCRVAALAGGELGDLRLQRRVDLCGALGELGEQLGGGTGNLGLTVDNLTERDPVAVGELGAQHRLIEAAERSLMTLQEPRVEGQPSSVEGLHLGRHDQMGLQLRIIRP